MGSCALAIPEILYYVVHNKILELNSLQQQIEQEAAVFLYQYSNQWDGVQYEHWRDDVRATERSLRDQPNGREILQKQLS